MGEERPEDKDQGGITKKAKKASLPKPPGMSWKCYDEHVAQDLNISKAKARRDRKVHGHGKQMLNNERAARRQKKADSVAASSSAIVANEDNNDNDDATNDTDDANEPDNDLLSGDALTCYMNQQCSMLQQNLGKNVA